MTNTLVHLARSLKLDELEAAWNRAIEAPSAEQVQAYADALDHLCNQDMASRALGMATAMIEALARHGHTAAAMELGFRVMRRSAHNDALARTIVGLIDNHYADRPWLPLLRRRAALDNSTVAAILEFDRLRRFTAGFVVYHPAGWGEGTVVDFDAATEEVTVRFASGRQSAFPFDTMLTSFKALDHDDLRAMKLQRMADLQREAEQDPSGLIRRAAALYRGTITSQQLKNELAETVVEPRQWAAWWKRAKAAATKDPWLRVEGSTTRPVFVVRDRPISLVDEASASLSHQNHLGERVAVLREYLNRSEDGEVRTHVLDLAAQTIAKAIEDKRANAEKGPSHSHILDGILFLEEHGRTAPVPAAEELRQLLVKPSGALEPTAIDKLATQASREHAIELLPHALGDDWADRCIAVLTEWPASVAENVVDKLVAQNHGALCLSVWDRVAPYPRRYPLLTYLLGKLYSDGVFEGDERRPAPVVMVRVLLQLGRVLNEDRKKNLLHSRLLSRLTSLLTGKRGLLQRAIDGISRDDLAYLMGIVQRAGEDFPQEIDIALDRAAAELYPELHAEPERPFWEKEHIFTTREGLRRIKEDYRVLVDEKIPANSKAIGAAASLGDLSENSEWESAMEEQRNLTGRAQEMDQQIRSARLIEEQDVPDDRVAPGTKITLAEEASGRQVAYRVLGPWDVTDDRTINYLAPMAQGLLGKSLGEVGELPSPSGPVRVRIEAIERIV